MDRIKSWYNKNRLKLFLGIIIISIIGILIYKLIDGITNNIENSKNSVVSDINTNTLSAVVMPTKKSIITGNDITTTQKEINVVDSFISHCNSKNIEQAYNLLSDECKNEMYPSIQDFYQKYYKANFDGQIKNVKIENWFGNTYKVNILPDALATGNYNTKDSLQDYITIVEDREKNVKININNYIGREIINKTGSSNGIEINVIQKDTYMDYEYYTVEIKNNNKLILKIGNLEIFNTSYLEDQNGIKYQAYMYELAQDDLRVYAGESKKLKIKYFNQFSSTRKIVGIVFSDMRVKVGDANIIMRIDL